MTRMHILDYICAVYAAVIPVVGDVPDQGV